eukprot:SM000094S24731  [mRNA]  locus=s94:559941:566319:- [translate_table: standard]
MRGDGASAAADSSEPEETEEVLGSKCERATWEAVQCCVMGPYVRIGRAGRAAVAAAWLLLALGITAAIFLTIYFRFQDHRQAVIEEQCSSWARLLTERFRDSSNHVTVFTTLISTFYFNKPAGTLDQATFEGYADATNYSRSLINGLGFALRVSAAEKPQYLREQGWGCIKEFYGNCSALSRRQYCCANYRRPEYAPLVLVQRPRSGMDSLAVDIYSDSRIEEAAQRALRGNGLSLTPPLDISGVGSLKGLIQVFPVYKSDLPPQPTEADYVKATEGFLLSGLYFGLLWEIVLKDLGKSQPAMFSRIYDVTNQSHPQLLYEPIARSLDLNGTDKYATTSATTLGDVSRQYEMRCRYNDAYIFPVQALAWALAALAILVLLSYIAVAGCQRMVKIEREYRRMKALRDQAKKAKNAAETASKAKGTFLATMSHEIRTPMNGVIGMLNLLLSTPLDSTQLDYVETARTSGRALCALINDVLDLSKIEAGKMDLEEIKFDLRAEVDDILSMFVERIREKPAVEVAAYVHDQVPAAVIGDPLRFRQVLINLLGNSCKFTDKGHIFICIRTADPLEDIFVDDNKVAGSGSQYQAIQVKVERWRSAATKMLEMRADGSGPLPQAQASRLEAISEGHSWPAEEAQTLVAFNSMTQQQVSTLAEMQKKEAADHGMLQYANLTLSGERAVESCNSWSYVQQIDGGPGYLGSRSRTVRLVVSVEDTGAGIPLEAQGAIFRPFVQADASTTRTYGGTGIGLSISQRLVGLMRGRMAFHSLPGIGTTFYFDLTLPFDASPSFPVPSPAQRLPRQMHLSDFEGRVAVLIDDRSVRRAVTEGYLRRLGLEVIGLAQPQELRAALDRARMYASMWKPPPGAVGSLADDDWEACAPVICMEAEMQRRGSPSHGEAEAEGGAVRHWRDTLLAEALSPLHQGTDVAFSRSKAEELTRLVKGCKAVLLVSEPRLEELARLAGYDATLLKPLRRTALAGCLAQALGKDHGADQVSKTAPNGVTMSPLNPMSRTNAPCVLPADGQAVPAAEVGTTGRPLQPPMRSRPGLSPQKSACSTLLTDLLSGKHFLVVDDNMVNRKVIQKMLQRYGVKVECVIGGPQAVAAVAANRGFDCVLMDLQMPEMDGFEATRQIRRLEAEAPAPEDLSPSRLPIFALTADIVVGTKEKSIQAGMDGYLTKPIEEEQLCQVLEPFFTELRDGRLSPSSTDLEN